MKSNVDLTANEIFSRQSWFLPLVKRTRKYPWASIRPIHSDMDLGGPDQLVHTGNRTVRYHKRLSLEADSMEYCDCCGKYLRRFPYLFVPCLCRACSKELDASYGHKKRFPPASIPKGAVPDRRKNPFRF